jgi:hypothetical protein
MRISSFLLLCSFFFLSKNSFAQDFNVPESYHFSSKEDYATYEKDIIGAARWLLATPLNEQEAKRKEVSSFVVQWISGSPTVTIALYPIISDFEKKNQGMMMIYLASGARYVLENGYSKDNRAIEKAALLDMISVYQTGKGINNDKKMEKLIKAKEENKLDDWLDHNMK